ncbi:hypothetical protein BKA70DRAFT_1360376 [Coprinopsis sp. MPI-PUGE-AT-0042]|nr:hypothetical protein BKA70DRAFT_1360376 [Coprinopsis sp. MPI-PUGE-AT-0042]
MFSKAICSTTAEGHLNASSTSPATKPHRCLGIPEVIELVFEWINDSNAKGSTLFALTTTCKAFHELSIKFLWKDLCDLHPIAGVFPNCAWRLKQVNENRKILYPDISFEDKAMEAFPRLRRYTRHVKSIRCEPWWWTNGDMTLYEFHYTALQAIHRHPSFLYPLFPNVRDVHLPDGRDNPLELVFSPALVLSPSVDNLTISVYETLSEVAFNGQSAPSHITTPQWTALANRVADIAPQLSRFTVELDEAGQDDGHWAGRIPALLDAFSHFSSLSHLDIVPLVINPSSLLSLGSLMNLKTLNMSLLKFQNDELGMLHNLRLTSLEHISIDNNSLQSCAKFLRILYAKQLKKLTLGCLLDKDTNPGVFFSTLHDCERYSRLEQIKIHRIYNGKAEEPFWRDIHDVPRFTFDDSTARSLIPFKRLITLSIGPCESVQISCQDLRDIFRSFPNLTRLELNDDALPDDYQAPWLSLNEIHEALQDANSLEALTLSFDGSAFPSGLEQNKTATRPHPTLKTWNVCSSSISLPTRFAAWLAIHYPALSEIKYFGTYMDGIKGTHGYEYPHQPYVLRMDSLEETAMMVDRWNSVKSCFSATRR